MQGQLGYIASDATGPFEHVCAPGYLLWAAAAQNVSDPILGADVECMPHLRAFHIQALPTELALAADLSRSLNPAVWRVIEALQLESTFGRCQLTGLQSVPLNATKVWRPRRQTPDLTCSRLMHAQQLLLTPYQIAPGGHAVAAAF